MICGAASPISIKGIPAPPSPRLIIVEGGAEPSDHWTKVEVAAGEIMVARVEQSPLSSACCQVPSLSFLYQTAAGSAVFEGILVRSAPVVEEVQLI